MHQKLIRHLTDDNDSFNSHYGGGWLSPDRKHFYVSIPKNASSFLGTWLTENGWNIFNFKGMNTFDQDLGINQLESVVVVLRDPIERFISGFAQYLKSNILHPLFVDRDDGSQSFHIEDIKRYWPAIERIMADVGPFFDDHTWPQYYYYEDILPHVPRKMFWLNPKNLERLFMTEFSLNPASDAVRANANRAVDQDEIMIQLQNLIKDTFNNPNYFHKIRKEFAPDYEIINTTKFIYHSTV